MTKSLTITQSFPYFPPVSYSSTIVELSGQSSHHVHHAGHFFLISLFTASALQRFYIYFALAGDMICLSFAL